MIKLYHEVLDDSSTKKLAKEDAWELIYETTLTEDTISLMIATDASGSAFELKQAMYLMYAPKASANATVSYNIGFSDGKSTSQDIANAIKTDDSCMTGFKFDSISLGLIKSNQQLQFNQPISNVLFPNEHIISVGNTATAIPSGTEIKLYGIRA